MPFFNRLIAILLAAILIAPVAPLQAKNKKGDKFYSQGRIHEVKKEWDAALEDYEKALSEDPAEMLYQMAQQKAVFQASEMHVDRGLKLRSEGQLGEALLEFQKAYAINPGTAVTSQELRLTQEMIDRERQRVMQTGKESTPEQRALTPVDEMKKEELDKIGRILPVPELKPLHPELMDLKMSGQRTKVIYETIGKLAGINVLWDPEYQPPAKDAISVDFQQSTLEEALDYVSVITKSFWKALSPNTIFITNDNANKRRDYEEQVTKVFYLQNVMLPAELQEIVNVVRTAADINRVFPYNSQFALVVRGEADRVELAGKLIHDLDRPKSEVVVDIYVMEASTVFSRKITAALASTGLNVPLNFSPRSGIQVQGGGSSSSTTTTGTTTTGNTTSGVTTNGATTNITGGTSSTTGTLIPAANLGRLSSSDWATTLPSALLQAAMSNANTKVLQAPQLRAVDMGKATMKIGERQPTASGSFQPGIGGVGINPLVNTQFTYIDVGVNIEMTARVHDNNEVSMHISLDISNITGSVNLGGIDEPIIGQRKIDHDLRMREGEVALLGGLINQQDNKTVTGIPGLSSIPLLRRLFSGESVDHNKDELMIILIPHIVRRPEITPENIRAIAVGNAQTISLRHAPRPAAPAAAPAAPAQQLPAPAVPAAAIPGVAGIIPGETKSEPSVPKTEPATNPNRIAAQPATTLPPATAPPLPPGIAPPPTGGVSPAAPMPPGATTTTTSPAAPAPGAGRVYFNQPQADVAVGSNFVVSVVLEGGSDVAQAPLQFSFDPKLLRLNDASAGPLLSADGQQAAFSKNIQNDVGQAAVQLSRPPGAPGITVPSGILVNLSFQAVGRGTAVVNMPGAAVRNSQGQVVAGGNAQMTVTIK
jgi:general secretion pathway protein D